MLEPSRHPFLIFLRKGKFPIFWKTSFITKNHKKCDKNDISYYRPIAKLSTIPKILESLIQISLNNVCKYVVSNNQHGFVPNKSTIANLLELSAYITLLYLKKQVDCIYTYFSKAFDILAHSVILLKLKKI